MSHASFKTKKNKRVDSIPLPKTTQTWDEPRPSYGARYPYNQVTETEAGHVIELDSTPGAERIHVFHKSGAYIEIDVNGSMVRKVIGDNYEVIDRNNFTYVKGSHCLTVEGKMNMLVRNSAQIVVEGSLAVTSHKDTSIETAGTATVVGKNINVSSTESLNLITEGSLNLQGKNINLYAKGGSISEKATQDFSMESGTSNTFSIKGGQSLLMDAAIVKTKMGANSIRGIAFGALPLPEAKTIDTTPVPVLQRDTLPESTFFFDAQELAAAAYVKALEEKGEINTKIVPVEIPTTTIPVDTVTKVASTTSDSIVTSTKTVTNVVSNTAVTSSTTVNTNQTNKVSAKTTIANTANTIVTSAETVSVKIAAFTTDTVDTAAQILDSGIKKIKTFLPTSKW